MSGFDAVLQVWAFAVALCVGSFLNVCIARMPEDRSVVSPGSHCPSCGYVLRWYDNIPLLSWAMLKAKCRNCGLPISPLYPSIELLTGVLGLLLWRELVPPITGPVFPWADAAAWVVYLAFISMLVASTFIDLRHYIIPDEFSIYAAPVGIAAVAGLSLLGFDGVGNTAHLALNWQQSVVGALVGGGSLLAVWAAWKLLRGIDAMGFGDIKLMAMMGAFLGALPAMLFVVLFACLAGTAIGIPLMIKQGRGLRLMLPFGPFLALGGLLYVYFGDVLVRTFLLGWA